MQILPDQRFHRLTTIRDIGADASRNRIWLCLCDCGNQTPVRAAALRRGEVRSCGCLQQDAASAQGKMRRKHGHRRLGNGKQSKTYTAWMNMKARCNNPRFRNYKDWGGRGITYDPRWEVFESFLADMGQAPDGLTLDRIDNDGNYCKENCRWADRPTQRRNRADVYRIIEDGEALTLKDYCEKHGLNAGNIYSRLHRGMVLADAIRLA